MKCAPSKQPQATVVANVELTFLQSKTLGQQSQNAPTIPQNSSILTRNIALRATRKKKKEKWPQSTVENNVLDPEDSVPEEPLSAFHSKHTERTP